MGDKTSLEAKEKKKRKSTTSPRCRIREFNLLMKLMRLVMSS